jgi:hypothetical protein
VGSASDLQTLAEDVLDASGQILGTTGNPEIERAFVSHGPPALDCCNQLAVHVAQIGEAATQAGTVLQPGLRHSFARINLTALMITVTRCHPVLDDNGTQPPSPAELTEAAAMLNADAWALWNGLYRAQDVLFDACDLVFFDGMTPLPPQGACAGWMMQIRFVLEGYAPPAGS